MRTIKFRGKSVATGEWVYGLPKYGSGGSINYICGWMGDDGAETYCEIEIDASTLSQGAGLQDKKGVEIFEGDIIRFAEKYNYQVLFADAKFVCYNLIEEWGKWGDLCGLFDYDFQEYHFEVIGNIHEKPEMLL